MTEKIDASNLRDQFITPTYPNKNITFERGEGVFLFDENNNKYLDCFSNIAVNIFGHSDQTLTNTITQQAKTLVNLYGSFNNSKRSLFAQKLCTLSGLDKVFFCNSGAEAVEAAIKFARLATKKQEILAAKMGFHGKTMGALSLTKTLNKYNEPFTPLLEHVKHFSYNNLDSLRETISENTAAVVLEPIQGESGVRIPNPDYLKEVRKICDEHGALLIIDEIQTGMGRTGSLFAFQQANIEPDILCLAKALAGGLPAGATLMNKKVAEPIFMGCHTTTFGGNPLICATGLTVLEEIKKRNLLNHVQEVGNYFLTQLKSLDNPKIREVRGKGLMIALELKVRAGEYAKKLQEENILVAMSGSTVLRFLPPLIFEKEHVDMVIEKLKKVLG